MSVYGIRGVVSDCESDEVTATKLKMSRTHALRIQIRKTALKCARPSMTLTTPSNHTFVPLNPRLGAASDVGISQRRTGAAGSGLDPEQSVMISQK